MRRKVNKYVFILAGALAGVLSGCQKSPETSVVKHKDMDNMIEEAQNTENAVVNVNEVAEKYDINVNLNGGGYKGQAEALRLAIARALVKINNEDKAALRAEGFMTRDPRAVERKKPGRPKARKRFQFSKR